MSEVGTAFLERISEHCEHVLVRVHLADGPQDPTPRQIYRELLLNEEARGRNNLQITSLDVIQGTFAYLVPVKDR